MIKSLEAQLRNALTFSLIVLFILFWWVTTYTIHQLVEQYVLTRLTHDAENLQSHLSLQNGQWHLTENSVEVIYQRLHSGHYYVIKHGQDVSVPSLSSRSLGTFPLYSPMAESHNPVYETLGPLNQTVLVFRLSFLVEDAVTQQKQLAYLFVAEDHTPIQKKLREFDWLFTLFSLLGLVGLWLLQKRILKRGFDSLLPVRESLKRVQSGDVAVIDAQVPKEIEPLVSTLNHVLSQLQARLERSRQATGNLAHALKSPLNLIYQLLEDQSLAQNAKLRMELLNQAKRIQELIERELSKARMAGQGVTLQAFDYQLDLADLVATLKQLYIDKAIDYQVVESPLKVLDYDREDMFELLGNILDNASKWCVSQVRIAAIIDPAWLRIVIEDDGPGVSHQNMQRMQNRGTQLDETQPGHGLGLSIVHEIVKAYGGQVQYSQHQSLVGEKYPPLAGLQVSILLPLKSL